MSYRHLLVHLDSAPRSAERRELAIRLAQKLSARLVGLFAEVDQLGPSLVARRHPSAVRDAREEARAAFERNTAAAGVDSEWWPIEATAHAEILDLAASCCRYVDLAILGQRDKENDKAPRELVEQVFLDSGRPVLVVPAVGHYAEVGRRVVIAWNASREAARAVNDAIPLLKGAEMVRVLAFRRHREEARSLPVPRADILAHLAAHGIDASLDVSIQEEEGANLVGTLLNYSYEVQADLTVLGAQGERFPLRHAVGSTRDILRSMPTTLLMSH
jgi:nucleotide-binding universal stress UspA family protein